MSYESTLSRVLAAENLTVVYSHAAKTASFDERSRTLVFPVFKEETPYVIREAFAVHEIGHAKYTPRELRHDKYKDGTPIPFGVLNVLEDIRIENLLKTEYPGARRTFAEAYWIHFRDGFFGDLGKIMEESGAKLHKLSRLNLLAKVGKMSGVQPVSVEEEKVFDRALSITTVQELLEVAELLKELKRPEPKKVDSQKKDTSAPTPLPQPKTEPDAEEPDAASDKDGDDVVVDEKESEPDEAESGADEVDDSITNDCADFGPDDDADDAEAGECSTPQDEPDDESEEGDSAGGGTPTSEPTLEHHEQEETQDSFDENLANLFASGESKDKYYTINASLYEQVFFNAVHVPWTEISHGAVRRLSHLDEKTREVAGKRWRKFGQKSQSLAAQFEQMISGINLANSTEQDSGELDENLLWAHKLTDELFCQERMQENQKNHGVLMMLDCSGSMSTNNKIKEVIERTMIMVQFCRAASIPFRVFAFGLRVNYALEGDSLRRSCLGNTALLAQQHQANFAVVPATATFGEQTSPEICSSEMSEVDLYATLSVLYHDLITSKLNRSRYSGTMFSLGGTPMLGTLLAMPSIIENFKLQNNIRKVCLMVLTDGQPTPDLNMLYRSNDGYARVGLPVELENLPNGRARVFYTHQSNNKQYQLSVQDAFRMIRDLTGAFTVFYRVMDHYHELPTSELYDRDVIKIDAAKQIVAGGCWSVEDQGGIDLQFVVYQKDVTHAAKNFLRRQSNGGVAEEEKTENSAAVLRFFHSMQAERKEAMFVESFVKMFA